MRIEVSRGTYFEHTTDVDIPDYHQNVKEDVEQDWNDKPRRFYSCWTCGAMWDTFGDPLADGDGFCLGTAYVDDLL